MLLKSTIRLFQIISVIRISFSDFLFENLVVSISNCTKLVRQLKESLLNIDCLVC